MQDELWRIIAHIRRLIKMNLREEWIKCKYCGEATYVVKFGKSRTGEQRYYCRKCKRAFLDNDALPRMRASISQLGEILGQYYGGMSLQGVRRQFEQQHQEFPSRSTIYRWLTRFTKIAIDEARSHTPQVGDVWVADETVLDIAGQKVWFWDIMDAKTRFLLASHLSTKRTTADALTLMKGAEQRAGKVPLVVLTDKLQAYLDGTEIAWGADAKHLPSKGFQAPLNTNLIERFHGSLKDRTKVMRGMKNIRTARLLMDGWLVHYNFFRTHEALGDKTPAEKAGIQSAHKNWLDVVKSQSPCELEEESDKSQPIRASPDFGVERHRGKVRKHRGLRKRAEAIVKLSGVRI